MSPRRRLAPACAALVLVAGPLLAGCGDDAATSDATGGPTTTVVERGTAPERLTLRIVRRVPHDTEAFTEGLTFDAAGDLYESLGIEGQSSVRQVDLDTGKVLAEVKLPADEFGEGLTAVEPDTLVQLTWQTGTVHVWRTPLDADDPGRQLQPIATEGWGLTDDGEHFISSDGSDTLSFRTMDAFEPPRSTLRVTRDTKPVDELNELEWVDGVLWSNVWHSDEILRIDPATGAVTGVLDASDLWQSPDRTSEMTLNGIAHRPGDPANRLWLTGKNWPEMFEVEVS